MRAVLSITILVGAIRGADQSADRILEIRSGAATLRVNAKGCGFIDAATYYGREVVRARDGVPGAAVLLTTIGSGDTASLFPHGIATTLQPEITTAAAFGEALTVWGFYSAGPIKAPFIRQITPGPKEDSFTVSEEVDFRSLPEAYAVAGHRFDVPLVVCAEEHHRLLGFGGARRAELFRMDMNDEPRRNQLISDNRAFQPYWDIGGVLQLPGSYRIWRANHADTMAYPIEEGLGAPGWADYAELDWGLGVRVPKAARAAPWAIDIDARDGRLSIAPCPESQPPRPGTDCGNRAFEFVLTFHRSSWPVDHPCELTRAQYRSLLDLLAEGSGYTHLDQILGGLGVAASEGPKTPAQLDDLCRKLFLRDRVQPSVLLRFLYRGDAWRMQGVMKQLLGRSVPRNQPFARWEKLARECLETVRKG